MCNMLCFANPKVVYVILLMLLFYYSSEYMVQHIHKFFVRKLYSNTKRINNYFLFFSSFLFLSFLCFLFIKTSHVCDFPWVISKFSTCLFNY